jgi:hypothetical protein
MFSSRTTDSSISFEGRLSLLAIFLTLATGKWGSWIGVPNSPFFLIDLIVILSSLLSFLKMMKNHIPISLYSLVLVFFMTFQIAINQEFNITTKIRDLSPFFYLLLVPFLAFSLNSVSFSTVIKVIRYGSITNLLLFYFTTFGLLAPFSCGAICGTEIFYYRADHVGLVACIGLMAWSTFSIQGIRSRPLIQILFALGILINQSRAGIIGMFLVVVLFLLPQIRLNSKRNQIKIRTTTLLIVGFPVAAIILNTNLINVTGFERFTQESVVQQISGESDGTTRARVIAQGLLLEYVFSEKQILSGAGAGAEMVRDSQAYRYLSSASDVRAPHNWFVGLLARYGIIGFLLWVLVSVKYYSIPKEKNSGSLLIKVSILNVLVSSAFGVMMESPFGALPFAYFLAMGLRYLEAQKVGRR